jgi:hypothetical protein
MTTGRLTVSFCCNDHRGDPRSIITAIAVDDLIQLEGPVLFDEDPDKPVGGTPIRWLEIAVWIGGRWFCHHGRSRHVGSLTWDAAEMGRADIVCLLNHLREIDGWSCIEAEASLFDVWGKREITAGDLERAMMSGTHG